MSCLRRFVLVALFAGFGAVAGCTTSDPAPVGGSGGMSGPAGSGGSAGAGGSGGTGTGGGSGGTAGSGSGGSTGSGGGQGTDAGGDTARPDTNAVDRPADTSPTVDAPVMPASPTLSTDIAPFIKMKCAAAGCHDPIKKEHGMDMSTAPLVYAAWVNRMTADHCANDMAVTRVVPSKPADSFVLKMVENIGRCSEMPRMPPAPRAALTAAEIKAIRDWITAGALNN